ncbi:Ig-like domain-containing protein [Taibaiella lutea]|nr:putative Ig domain-containing protein [Taibaiella lutea]
MKPKFYLKKAVSSASLLAALLSANIAFSQTPTVRSYATRQGNTLTGIDILGSTSTLDNAIDNDPFTSSNLTIGIGVAATRTQILDFNPNPAATTSYATAIAANTPITVKFSLPAGLVSALGNLEIQAVTDLHKNGLGAWVYTSVGPTYSGSSLVGLLSGAGSQEFTITPSSAYQGIRVSITGLASVAAGIDIYDAYIKTTAPGSIVCSSPIDLLNGVRAGTVVGGIANATGGVVNPRNAIDNSMATYTTLNTGAQVLSQVYHTTMFNTPSKIGDTVKLVVQDASSALLNLSALAGLTLNFYNGSNGAPVQTITNNPSLLTLNLLNASNNMMSLVAVPTAVFDRVELQLGGVAGAFQSIRVYEVTRLNAGVALTNSQKDIYTYAGNSFTLSASAIGTGDVISYYDALTGGNLIASTTINTTVAQGGTVLNYFAGTTRNGCSESSGRKQITAHIVAFTNGTPGNGNVGVIYNGSVAITPQSPNVLPLTPVYNYTTSSTLPPGVTLNATTGMLSGMPTFSGSFPLTVTVNDVANNVPVGTFNYTVVINNTPLDVNLVSFDGKADNDNIILSWIAVNNTGNKGFEIERSADGKVYNKIGYVNGNEKGTYEFIDESPLEDLNQYRLKILDNEGSYTYSNTISVKATIFSDIQMYPNPMEGNVLYVKGSHIKHISVSNSVGQNINVPVEYSNSVQQLSTQSLSKGIYYLHVVKSDNVITVYKFAIK